MNILDQTMREIKKKFKIHLGLSFQYIGLVFMRIGVRINPTVKEFHMTTTQDNKIYRRFNS